MRCIGCAIASSTGPGKTPSPIARKISGVRIAVLVGNFAIVAYLIFKLRQERRTHAEHPEPRVAEAGARE